MKIVIGIGDPTHQDDGVGPALASRLRRIGLSNIDIHAIPASAPVLSETWSGATLAILVSAVLSHPARPGQIHRTVLTSATPPPIPVTPCIPEALALTPTLPSRLIIYSVEAANLTPGPTLTPTVSAALPELLDAILTDLGT